MKKLLFYVLPFLSVAVFGQQKVYSFKRFEEKVMGVAALNKTYPTIGLVKLENFHQPVNIYEVEKGQVLYDYQKFARNKNFRFHQIPTYKSNHYVPVQVLFNEKGEIDYFVYGFQNGFKNKYVSDSLSIEDERRMIEISEEFCKAYNLPIKITNQRFALLISINLGMPPRMSRKNVISTLVMAENCDKPDTVKSLMLNSLYLEHFPDVVFKFKNLEKLDISNNFIEKIPNEIWHLKKLKLLSLSGNRIDYTNFKFRRNKHLKDLNLQFTSMSEMPKSLKRNRNLEVLFLGNNRINFLRNNFNRMKHLKALNLYNVKSQILPKSISKLKNLEELDLYFNDLQFLPKEVCQLSKLKTLAIANNQLWNLPEEISKMPNLQFLYAHHNRLNFLPNLPNLRLLDIGYNLFKVFPEQVYQLKDLEEFDITHNEIIEIPEGLIALNKLQKVYIRGNDFNKTEIQNVKLAMLIDSLEKRRVLVR